MRVYLVVDSQPPDNGGEKTIIGSYLYKADAVKLEKRLKRQDEYKHQYVSVVPVTIGCRLDITL